jgi:hypothetical protein
MFVLISNRRIRCLCLLIKKQYELPSTVFAISETLTALNIGLNLTMFVVKGRLSVT